MADSRQFARLPMPVTAYLLQLSLSQRAPAFLLMTAAGTVAEAGGECARYGLAVQPGEELPDSWRFLQDFLPLPAQEPSLALPFLQLGDGIRIDVHLVSQQDCTWIILLDASAEEERQRLIQQKTNELTLQDAEQRKLLRQYVGAGVAETLPQQRFNPTSEGERRVLTVLFADICGFTSYSQARSPGLVFRTLNAYLRAMIESITGGGGFIDKLIGDEVMALFGLLPSAEEGCQQAVQAAVRVIHGVRALHARADLDVALEVSVGIATGPVAIGSLGTRERRSFTAIGHHVNLAARLESHAQPGELLIDETTHQSLGDLRAQFQPRQLHLKGLTQPLAAFGLLPPRAGA